MIFSSALRSYSAIISSQEASPFKAKAWLDLKQRKENGEQVDSKNILKHKRDVFRLSQLITEADRIELGEEIKSDMEIFIKEMENDDIILKDIGVSGNKEDILELLRAVYKITVLAGV